MQQQSDIRSTVEDGSGFMEGFQSTERADRNRDDAVSSSGLMKGCGMDEKTTATSSFTDLFIADEGTVDREIGLIFDSVVTKGGPMVGVGAVDRAIGMTLDSVVTKDIPMVGVAKAHKEGTRGQEYTKDLHMQHSHHYKLKPWYNDTRKLTTANSHERRRKSLMIENADKEETRIKRHRYRSPSSEPAIYSRHRNVPLFLEEFQCKSRDPSVGRMRSNSATTFTVNTDNDICDGGYDHWQKIEEWRSKATPDDKVRIAGWLNAIAKKGDQPVRRDLEKTVVYFGNRVDFESIIPLLVNVEFDDIAAERLQICVKQFSTRGESTRSEYIAIQAKYLAWASSDHLNALVARDGGDWRFMTPKMYYAFFKHYIRIGRREHLSKGTFLKLKRALSEWHSIVNILYPNLPPLESDENVKKMHDWIYNLDNGLKVDLVRCLEDSEKEQPVVREAVNLAEIGDLTTTTDGRDSTSTNRYTRAYRNTETLNAMNTAQGIRFDVMANKVESNVAVGIDPMVTENEKNTREQIWAADCTMKDLFCLKDQLDMEVSECKRLEKQKSDLKYKVDRQVQLLFERCDLLKMPLDEENLFFCKIEKAKNAVEQLVAANRQSKENARKLQREVDTLKNDTYELRNRYNEQEYFLKKQAEIKQQFDALKDSMRSYR